MKWMKRKSLLLLLVIASLCFSIVGSAYAFDDIGNDPEKASIEQLEKLGVLEKSEDGKFTPGAALDAGTAVSWIVKGMKLNIDNIRFIKKPEASDYFTKVQNDSWYAEAFIIAHLNGLDLPKDIDPAAPATREQFAHWLYQAIERNGDFAWIEIFVLIKDEGQIDKAYMNSIQRLLIGKIATLDKDGNFRPKASITRSEAAGMLNRAIEFVKNVKPVDPAIPGNPDDPVSENPEASVLSDVKLSTEKVNAALQRITLSASVPHPGYAIQIAGVDFVGDKAYVNYRLVLPDPAAFYPQVITESKATWLIMSYYKAELGKQLPAVERKQETDNGTVNVPVVNGKKAPGDTTPLPAGAI